MLFFCLTQYFPTSFIHFLLTRRLKNGNDYFIAASWRSFNSRIWVDGIGFWADGVGELVDGDGSWVDDGGQCWTLAWESWTQLTQLEIITQISTQFLTRASQEKEMFTLQTHFHPTKHVFLKIPSKLDWKVLWKTCTSTGFF